MIDLFDCAFQKIFMSLLAVENMSELNVKSYWKNAQIVILTNCLKVIELAWDQEGFGFYKSKNNTTAILLKRKADKIGKLLCVLNQMS